MLQALKDLEGKSKDLFEALTLQFAKNTKLQAGTAMNISGNVIVKPKIESDPTDGASFMKVPCDKKSDAASITIKAEGAGISVQDAAKAPVKADKAEASAEKATKDAAEKSTAADKAKADATDAKKEAEEKKTKDVEDKKAKETKEAEDKKTKETKEAEDKKTKETKEAEDKKKKEAAAKK